MALVRESADVGTVRVCITVQLEVGLTAVLCGAVPVCAEPADACDQRPFAGFVVVLPEWVIRHRDQFFGPFGGGPVEKHSDPVTVLVELEGVLNGVDRWPDGCRTGVEQDRVSRHHWMS